MLKVRLSKEPIKPQAQLGRILYYFYYCGAPQWVSHYITGIWKITVLLFTAPQIQIHVIGLRGEEIGLRP